MGFVDAVKDFVGFGDVDYEEDIDMDEEEVEDRYEERAPIFSK